MDRKIVLSNFTWRFLERWGAQGVTFVVSIILARLLDPSVYGYIALVTVFTTVLNIFIDGGFGNALIQKKNADDLDFSTVFYFNIIFSITLYCIVFLCAPMISRFYGNNDLIPVVRVMALTLVISGIKNIQQAYISKNMLFKKFFFATIGGTICAAIVGIWLAYKGFGVWALVIQNLLNQFIDTVILWFSVKWRPLLKFSLIRLASLFKFGWKLLISNLVYNSYNELRQLLIGKIYTPEQLAFYNEGHKFPSLISSNINSSIDSVLFPVMSRAQDNKSEIRSMLRRSILISQYVVAPCVLGFAVCSESFVRLVLTDKWLPCVPYIKLFCLANVFGFIGNANQNAIIALGHSDLKLKIEITKTILDLIVLSITVPLGPLYIAVGVALSSVIRIAITSWPNKELMDYSFFQQMRDLLPGLCCSFLMAGLVSLVSLLNLTDFLTLLIQIPLGVIVYILISILTKSETFYYLYSLVCEVWRKK